MKKFLKSTLASLKDKHFKNHFFKSSLGNANPFNLPKNIVKKANSLGFTAEEYVLYNLAENDPQEYCSQLERKLFSNRIASYRVLLDNKIVFQKLISPYVKVNKVLAYKTQGHYHAIDEVFAETNIINAIAEKGKVVGKEFSSLHNSGCGHGFHIFEYKDKSFYDNNVEVSSDHIANILLQGDDYMLEEYCIQSDFENKIFPKSVNTIRFLTAKDRATGKIYPLYAIHRMGASSDSVADNASLGGLQCEINLETGALNYATSYAPGIGYDENLNQIHYDTHPITGTKLEGLIIPDWENIKKTACDLHDKLAYTGIIFIAWDFALSQEGLVVIEANATCGFRLLQTHEGCRNNIIGKWFKDNNLIK